MRVTDWEGLALEAVELVHLTTNGNVGDEVVGGVVVVSLLLRLLAFRRCTPGSLLRFLDGIFQGQVGVEKIKSPGPKRSAATLVV